MKIRASFVLVPLVGALLACWWLLSRALADAQPLGGQCHTVIMITIFVAPIWVVWRVMRA